MKRLKSTALLIMALIFIVINVVFFLWVDASKCGLAEWYAYGFMAFSFLFACISILIYNGRSDEVYSLTTVYIPLKYFYVQTVLSALGVVGAMYIRAMPDIAGSASFFIVHYATVLLTIYLIVMVVYLVRFIMHSAANKATEESLQQQYEEHAYVRDVAPVLANYMPLITDANAKKAVNNLYETIRFSANKTSAQGQANRIAVTEGVDQLTGLIEAQDWQAVMALATRLNLKAKQM